MGTKCVFATEGLLSKAKARGGKVQSCGVMVVVVVVRGDRELSLLAYTVWIISQRLIMK